MCSYSGRHLSPTSILLLLVCLCAATEYHVKPTIPQETSCPRESCYTMDELATKYFYASATDVLTDNVTVILLKGNHELKGSIIVKEVNDFTLLGAGGANGVSHVEINCKRVSSLAFNGIINLTITGIKFSQCGVLNQATRLQRVGNYIDALKFSDVFNLRLTWVVIQNSTRTAIVAVNLLGTSVIDHSVFQSYNDPQLQSNHINSHHIDLWYENCNQIHYNSHRCTNNSHKLHIHNCVLRNGSSGSMTVHLYHSGYEVEVDLMNVTAHNGGGRFLEGDIFISVRNEANYMVTIRDSYIGHSKGAAISVVSQHPKASVSQLLHITNSVIDRGAGGINFEYYSYYSPGINITAIQQMIIENSIIMDCSGDRLQVHRPIRVLAENSQLEVVLCNVSFKNNKFPQTSVIDLLSVTEFELINCRFVGNQGTPIALHDSTINVSGTLSFVNNTAYEGGAMAFYGESYMSVNLENNTQILFINNYAEHVGGAIFAEETAEDELCFLQLATPYSECSDFKNIHQVNFVFTNNTAHHGGDAIFGGSLQHCTAGHCNSEKIKIPILGVYVFIINYWNLVQYDTGHHSNLSLISSTPSRVCLCEDGRPDCLTMLTNDTHYPGETFSISAIVVGQGFGTVDGRIYAHFTNTDTPRLKELQQSQQVKHSSCANLKYTIFSAAEKEAMVLSTRTAFSEYDAEQIDNVIEGYNIIHANQYHTTCSQ